MLLLVCALLCFNYKAILAEESGFGNEMLSTVPYLLQLEAKNLQENDRQRMELELDWKQHETLQDEHFDFIVVGGGTAGCIVAARLSEKFSVLLIEAGGDPPSGVSIPIFNVPVAAVPDINYLYKSIPQKFANNRIMDMSMGKMLGGTGSHNTMLHNRGNPKDYDNWADIANDPSWRYENLLQYFKKSESYTGIWSNNGQHGRHGPTMVQSNLTPLLSTWKKAAFELGYSFNDPNGPQKPGFATCDITRTVEDGRRVSSYTAYIQPILDRKTLKIVRYAEADKLLFSGRRVTGVQYLRHGRHFRAQASREVILCAGTIGTPLLLFKSGIGPSKMLAEAGINPILNSPAVGTNMQDHHGPVLPPLYINQSLAITPSNFTAEEFEKFLNHRPDSVASLVRMSTQGFFISSLASGSGWPDIHLRQRYICVVNTQPNQICFDIVVGRPQFTHASAGTLTLNATAYLRGERDNLKLAVINPKVLESQRVFKILKESVALYQKIVGSRAFKSVGATESIDAHCAASNQVNSDAYWDCYITNHSNTHIHTVGTCRMGRNGDLLNSVVDSKLRVHGIQKLRIVDASIMPHVTNTNTNAPVMVIAEKSAGIILREHFI